MLSSIFDVMFSMAILQLGTRIGFFGRKQLILHNAQGCGHEYTHQYQINRSVLNDRVIVYGTSKPTFGENNTEKLNDTNQSIPVDITEFYSVWPVDVVITSD